MSTTSPEGYLGTEARITRGPAPELVEAGYAVEIADAPLLHRGLGLADLAHLLALYESGVVPTRVATALSAELLKIIEVPAESFPYDPVYGDAYNSRERELERRLDTGAGWLHTGRTRREAGRIAFRVALRGRLLALHEAIARFVSVAGARADAHADTLWADHTYLQPAQPSTWGHYLGGFGEEAARHLDRVEKAFELVDQAPVGVGGVGGSRIALDVARTATRLAFTDRGAHTRDIMWATDGVTDAALAAVQAAITADRFAEDMEIFTSPAFGYVTLDASLCRASVLLPQKRNPYALAVIRADASTLIGTAAGLLTTARTPSARTDNWLHTYRQVAEAVDGGRRTTELAALVMDTLEVDTSALLTAAGAHFTGASDLAEELVLRCRIDYRSAHRIVGAAVARALDEGVSTLTPAALDGAAKAVLGRPLTLDEAVLRDALDPRAIVATRTVRGGSAPEQVRAHAERLAERAGRAADWSAAHRTRIDTAEERLLAEARAVAARVPPA
ncbi:lyase family protein [Streptomyces sp. NPDC094038]|uniref:lyase family protein n=1 Tax=Streptomyces sp. NPDC094038 TaxID=3366055 RepID=UPI00381317F6